ncbi:MAG: hypothetical protein HKO92_00370 [Flavobacteriaceae bacterium]|nr:hypothetical protein [Flavobacteriaceae bacterium]
MKKRILSTLVVLSLSISACSNNDDKDTPSEDCRTCLLELLGESTSTEICDNGDGTVTITSNGEEETQDLDGATFAQLIAGYELLGASCN